MVRWIYGYRKDGSRSTVSKKTTGEIKDILKSALFDVIDQEDMNEIWITVNTMDGQSTPVTVVIPLIEPREPYAVIG